jgi:hypothetical protein
LRANPAVERFGTSLAARRRPMTTTVPRPGRADAIVERLLGLSVLLVGSLWLLVGS